jgi:hypothetical protein
MSFEKVAREVVESTLDKLIAPVLIDILITRVRRLEAELAELREYAEYDAALADKLMRASRKRANFAPAQNPLSPNSEGDA